MECYKIIVLMLLMHLKIVYAFRMSQYFIVYLSFHKFKLALQKTDRFYCDL